VLVAKRLVQRRETLVGAVSSTAPVFCVFVLALGVVVRAVSDRGLGSVTRHLLPMGTTLPDLLAVAAIAAVAANLLNNLPATLLLLPVAARGGVGPVLAVLVGVDIGPNLTYAGSLATLLWRRVVSGAEARVPTLREFTLLGVATVPVAVTLATVALWLSLRGMGS
jgi:arsenical pump membrane protein